VSDGPLSGLRVIDASTIFAGPLAATILGDFGAEVVKVEHPRGDPMRYHGHAKDGQGLWWKVVGRNKRSVVLNLSEPAEQERMRQLVARADVLIENFRPGVMERWGLGWEQLSQVSPGLVMLRVTGFGQSGPYSSRPAFGTLIEAMSGFAHITGQPDGPPTLPPFGLADGIAGLAGAVACLMALYHRDARGGAGQEIDLAILEPIVTLLGAQATVFDQLGVVQRRTGNRSASNAPRNAYRTADDRWVAISTSSQRIAEDVVRLIGRGDLVEQPWFANGGERAEHADELDAAVGAWIGERDLEETLRAFAEVDAAIAPVHDTRQLIEDPQARARDLFVTVPDEDLGPLLMQNLLFRMGATPGAIRFPGRPLGEDSEAVFGDWLGVAPEPVASGEGEQAR
jgi:crotonobetainyl-CoA:carnitine CoA-transferase CaiB-like acyl-CoA transferase